MQQIFDQRAHAGGGLLHAVDVIAALVAQGFVALGLKPVAEGLNFSQRFLQIVRGNVGEILQFAVALLQSQRKAATFFLALLCDR